MYDLPTQPCLDDETDASMHKRRAARWFIDSQEWETRQTAQEYSKISGLRKAEFEVENVANERRSYRRMTYILGCPQRGWNVACDKIDPSFCCALNLTSAFVSSH